MKFATLGHISVLLAAVSFSANVMAADPHGQSNEASGPACEGFGPQTPRDIDSRSGSNEVSFSPALPSNQLNLCNIHFHKNAEHKAAAFSIYAGDGHNGFDSGYQCGISKNLTEDELRRPIHAICHSDHGDLLPGDTIEVHWVHTSCDVKPGPGLGSCSSEGCVNPKLRVETQVFTLVNDYNALNFLDLVNDNSKRNGFYQAKMIPSNTGRPIEFLGSTTGPKYSEQSCSPLQVTWSVRPQCAKLDINSLGEWCKGNIFEEDHAHGVRKLVTNPKLLSVIK